MKNKTIIRLFTAALTVALCATAFAVPAFAGGGEGEPYYTETAGTEADPAEDAEAPEVTITDEEDPAGDDSADNNTEADGDTLDQITELLGGNLLLRLFDVLADFLNRCHKSFLQSNQLYGGLPYA